MSIGDSDSLALRGHHRRHVHTVCQALHPPEAVRRLQGASLVSGIVSYMLRVKAFAEWANFYLRRHLVVRPQGPEFLNVS